MGVDFTLAGKVIINNTQAKKALKNTAMQMAELRNAVQRSLAPTEAMSKKNKNLVSTLHNNAAQLKQVSGQFDSLGGALHMPMSVWRKFNQEGGKFNTIGGKTGNQFRKMTHGLRGFRMEMLGVMFFGMGMSKFFKGLLQPALELTGIFDLFRVTLQMLFLPVALLLLGWFIPIMNYFMELSPAVKMAIGIFVLLGVVVGTLLFLFGMMALGLGSLVLVFEGASLITFGSVLLGIAAAFTIIVGIVKVAKGEWEGLGLIIAGIGAILVAFGMLWAWPAILAGVAVYLIIKHWDALKQYWKDWWQEIKDGFTDLWEFITTGSNEALANIVAKFTNFGLKKLIPGYALFDDFNKFKKINEGLPNITSPEIENITKQENPYSLESLTGGIGGAGGNLTKIFNIDSTLNIEGISTDPDEIQEAINKKFEELQEKIAAGG